jgi:hypothetical protein
VPCLIWKSENLINLRGWTEALKKTTKEKKCICSSNMWKAVSQTT